MLQVSQTRVISGSPAGQNGGNSVLPIKRIDQAQSEWCWAACGEMIATYLKRPSFTQCMFANGYLARTGYCVDACKDPGTCNSPCRQQDISIEYAKAGISSVLVPAAIDTQTLHDEVGARQPVLAMVQYQSGASHVVLLTGYSRTASVFVIDTRPGHGEGWIDYAALRQALGHGAWTTSWTGIK
jgi:hypothetical protein